MRRRTCIGNPEGKMLLGRPRCRWVDNIKMDVIETRCGGVEAIGLAQDWDKWRALLNTVSNVWVP
jgi:hypothetical protein